MSLAVLDISKPLPFAMDRRAGHTNVPASIVAMTAFVFAPAVFHR
jgi:hypothetical protein